MRIVLRSGKVKARQPRTLKRFGASLAKDIMEKEQKIKTFLTTTECAHNFVGICQLAGIEKTKGHRWLNGERKLTREEIISIENVLKNIRYK